MTTDNLIVDTAIAYLASNSGPGEADAKTLAKIVGRREDLVTEVLMGAVQDGALRRVRNDAGVLVFRLTTPAQLPTVATPAPAASPRAAVPSPPGLPPFVITMAPPITRVMPAGHGKWDGLFQALMDAERPANGLRPTVDSMPIQAAKAISSAARAWARKRGIKPCPISVSTRGGKLLVQRNS